MKTYSDCMEVREDFSAYLDGEMGTDARSALEGHLTICADCLRELDGLKRVDDSYRKLDRPAAAADFETGVRDAVRVGYMPSGNQRTVPRWMGPLVAMASAAAVLVVGVLVLELRQAKPAATQIASAPPEVKKSISDLSAAARAPLPAQTGGSAALQDKSTSTGGSAWKNFAKAPASAAPTASSAGVGREDNGEALKQGLEETKTKSDQLAANAAAPAEKATADGRSDVIGTPPPAPKAVPMKERVLDAPTTETEALPQAVAPSSPAPGATGEVTDRQTLRSFTVRADGTWYERGYNNEPRTPLKRESPELRDLMKKHSGEDWMKLLSKKSRIVFEVNGAWYELEPETK